MKTPIHHVLSGQGDMVFAIDLIYENVNGTAGLLQVELNSREWRLLSFADSGPQHIEWERFMDDWIPTKIVLLRRPAVEGSHC